mgnify:FL=1
MEKAQLCRDFLENKKGLDIKIIKADDSNVLADYIVIATGTSTTHVKALADEVEVKFKEVDILPHHIEESSYNSWILLDYGDVIVHVFLEESRRYYNLYGEVENLDNE